MTVKEMALKANLSFLNGEEFAEREVSGAYACDLLSWVIGRAQENSALITVMTNVNVVAVAAMADLSCVILTEGVKPDSMALSKAQQNDIILLSSSDTTYEVSAKLSKVFGI